MKAKICAIEDNTFDVFLHVTIKDEKVRCLHIYKPVRAFCYVSYNLMLSLRLKSITYKSVWQLLSDTVEAESLTY